MGENQEISIAISRDTITLLSPPTLDLVPDPPTQDENVVIFTDAREIQPCATCAPLPAIQPNMLQDTMTRLYGPQTTGQIDPQRITSFTFAQLTNYLSAPSPSPAPTPSAGETVTPTWSQSIQAALERADWVVFAMFEPSGNSSGSNAVRRFLAQQADTLRSPHVVVIAYDAPYYLDATEVSKLSAYIAAYSRIESFVETSVRTLFGEFAPAGASPVSVTGINYDLTKQIAPDPEQTIALEYAIGNLAAEGDPTPEPTTEGEATPEPPVIEVGDALRLRTGLIIDCNGHPVPNGTPVQFFFAYPAEGLEHSITAVTRDGVAEAALTLERTGQLDISLQADPVPRRVALQIIIQEGEPAVIVPITPTPSPTLPRPTSTPTDEPEHEAETTEPPTRDLGIVEEEIEPPAPEEQTKGIGPLELLLALIASLLVGSGGYYLLRMERQTVSQALRAALWCIIGGLGLYLCYVLRLPGSMWLQEQSGRWAAGWVTLFGSLAALAAVWLTARGRPPTRTAT